MKKLNIFFIVLLLLCSVHAQANIREIDFTSALNLTTNAAGPMLVRTDVQRNRIIAVNTLTSSISIIDGQTHAVSNIPIAGRGLQHLKAECLDINTNVGTIYLIGDHQIHIINPDNGNSRSIDTAVQLESVTVDKNSGNAFFVGRECRDIIWFDSDKQKLRKIRWVDHVENLVNLNQTPPPPIRKVVADSKLQRVFAIDGFTSTLYALDSHRGKLKSSRKLPLTSSGRWHLAGYNEQLHTLYLVTETAKRRVIEAAKIDVINKNDQVVKLPQYTEGVGIIYNIRRDEIYIPYDNHASVHVVDFSDNGTLHEIMLPAYGNDASALDLKNDLLYIASWAHGEIDIVNMNSRHLEKRITDLGIIPHTFTLAFNPNNNFLYFPKGASAVNGTFGAAITALDPLREFSEKIYLGWSPVDLIENKTRNSFLIFNNEDQFAEVTINGRIDFYDLPVDYPISAAKTQNGNFYLSYGPHQSYWPVVYIWGARNGIMTIDAEDFSFYDRRIPRQAQKMAIADNGVCYFTQNNWGREEQFLGKLTDEIRLPNINKRLRLIDEVEREITQRILKYDPNQQLLYLARIGEQDDQPGILQIIEPDSNKVIRRIEVGLTPTDLVFNDSAIYVANFSSNLVSVISKNDYSVSQFTTDEQPLKLCRVSNSIFCLNHSGRSLQQIGDENFTLNFPTDWRPDNLFNWNGTLLVTAHNAKSLFIAAIDPDDRSLELLHELRYPFGDTRFDSGNVSFYVPGQFGDAIFSITSGKTDSDGRFWLTDFLAGKLFILSQTN